MAITRTKPGPDSLSRGACCNAPSPPALKLHPSTSESGAPQSLGQGVGGREEKEKLVNELELATGQPEGMGTRGIKELVIITFQILRTT